MLKKKNPETIINSELEKDIDNDSELEAELQSFGLFTGERELSSKTKKCEWIGCKYADKNGFCTKIKCVYVRKECVGCTQYNRTLSQCGSDKCIYDIEE